MRHSRLCLRPRKGDTETVVSLLQQAADLSGAEFASTLYDDWVIVERTRLLHLRHEALQRLASLQLELGRNADAEETARTLIRKEPACERAHDIIIAVRVAAGDYSRARRHYAVLEQVLRDELGSIPSAESRAPPIPRESHGNPVRGRRVLPRLALTSLHLVVLAVWFGTTRGRQLRAASPGVQVIPVAATAASHKPVWVYHYTPLPDKWSSTTVKGGKYAYVVHLGSGAEQSTGWATNGQSWTDVVCVR